MAYIVCENRFRQAQKFVAMNAGLLLQTFGRSNGNLCAEAVVLRIDRGANQPRKTGVDQRLPADHDKYTLFAWIPASWLTHQVEVAAFHGNR